MLSTLVQNLVSFITSDAMLTNLIVLSLILLVMHFLLKMKIKDCISIAVGYIILMFVLALFNIHFPGLLDIGKWIATNVKNLWNRIW